MHDEGAIHCDKWEEFFCTMSFSILKTGKLVGRRKPLTGPTSWHEWYEVNLFKCIFLHSSLTNKGNKNHGAMATLECSDLWASFCNI
jgi:hypothetical protein